VAQGIYVNSPCHEYGFASLCFRSCSENKRQDCTGKTVVGYISDGSCGLQHMAGMDEKDCTLMCVKNGKFVLADRDHKLVYQLDKTGQERAREFAGQKVRVKGRVTGKTIRVTTIGPPPN